MLILKLLIVISYLKSSNDNLIREQIFERFTTAFNDENTLQNWMKLTKRESICEPILFKEILRKIGDIVSMINTKKYTNIKSLFMKTNMKLENIGYPYLETYNIIASTKRIISIYDGLNASKTQNAFTLSEEALYYEYDQIYKIHELAIVEIWHKIHFGKIPTNLYDESTVKNSDLPNSRHSCTSIIKFYDLFNYTLIALFPTNFQATVYVVTNSKGLQSSRWCTENSFHCFIREKSTTVCPPLILQNLRKCKLENSIHELIDLKELMKQSYICDRTTAKVLIMLFHYYSDVKSKSTIIDIIRTKDNEYHIKWSFSKSPSLRQIKEYWMKQDIDNFASRPIFYKFNSGNINKSNYSTNRSIQTHKNPIKTRLILLSCGHQLGFGFIDKFFRKYYMKYSNMLDCPTCKKDTIFIVGSYEAIVYKYKKKLHLVQFVKNERIIFHKYKFLQIKYLISI